MEPCQGLPPEKFVDALVGGPEESVTRELEARGFDVVVWHRDRIGHAVTMQFAPNRICMSVKAGIVTDLKWARMEDLPTPNGDNLDEMLRFDPLDAAEKITGENHKSSTRTTGLGMLLMMNNNDRKRKALHERGDTCFTEETDNYQRIIQKNGFKKVLELDFITKKGYDSQKEQPEKFFVYWHDDGLVLVMDTSNLTTRNSAKVYYNWRPKDYKNIRVTSSGSFDYEDGQPSIRYDYKKEPDPNNGRPMFWTGDHDAREAIVHNMDALREHGEFMRPWKKAPFLWFLHHGDTDNRDEKGNALYDSKAINAERIALLPDYVRECIGKVDL